MAYSNCMEEASVNSMLTQNLCEHGIQTASLTSWSKMNPGRRFLRCKLWKDNDCGFFQWIDPEMSGREKHICCSLLNKIDGLKEKVSLMAENERSIEERMKIVEAKAIKRKENVVRLQLENTNLRNQLAKQEAKNQMLYMAALLLCLCVFIYFKFLYGIDRVKLKYLPALV